MEPPEKTHAVLQAMSPIDQEIAQQNDFDRLEPPGLRRDGVAKTLRNDSVEPVAEVRQDPEDQPGPEQILAKEETKVGDPGRTKEPLPGPEIRECLVRQGAATLAGATMLWLGRRVLR